MSRLPPIPDIPDPSATAPPWRPIELSLKDARLKDRNALQTPEPPGAFRRHHRPPPSAATPAPIASRPAPVAAPVVAPSTDAKSRVALLVGAVLVVALAGVAAAFVASAAMLVVVATAG